MNTVTEPINLDKNNLGIYHKYDVTRADGSSAPGEKHEHDEYFVLNLTTDKHAIPALSAYAKSCEADFPALASDLRTVVRNSLQSSDEFVTVSETTLPSGLVVPAFLVGQYYSSKNGDGMTVISKDNKPWVRINHDDSMQACKEAGYDPEFESRSLAIRHQICQIDENWTGGKVGEGEVYRGLHLGTVNGPQDGHYESPNPLERRWHVLANGERIYDFSGNIYARIYDDIQGDEKGLVAKPFTASSPSISTAPYPSMEKGIGWQPSAIDDWSGSALIRGGYWYSDDYAGVFYLNYHWPDYEDVNVGFRCTKSL